MSLLRSLAAAVILTLLLVPALTRAGQPLHAAHNPTPVPSFTKSVDVPPEPVVVVPDISRKPIDTEPLLQPVGRGIPTADEVVPAFPAVADATSLRAPPASVAA